MMVFPGIYSGPEQEDAESIVFRAEANQAAFAAFFFVLGSGATVAFMFAWSRSTRPNA